MRAVTKLPSHSLKKVKRQSCCGSQISSNTTESQPGRRSSSSSSRSRSRSRSNSNTITLFLTLDRSLELRSNRSQRQARLPSRHLFLSPISSRQMLGLWALQTISLALLSGAVSTGRGMTTSNSSNTINLDKAILSSILHQLFFRLNKRTIIFRTARRSPTVSTSHLSSQERIRRTGTLALWRVGRKRREKINSHRSR